jgi:hypothetical protein
MNYNIYINGQFWEVLSYPTPVPVGVVASDIDQARAAGLLSSFEVSDGAWAVTISPQK